MILNSEKGSDLTLSYDKNPSSQVTIQKETSTKMYTPFLIGIN